MRTIEKIDSYMFIDETRRLNEKFVKEAIREWDLRGQGRFDFFVKAYIDQRWIELLESN